MDTSRFDNAIVDPDLYARPADYHKMMAQLRREDPLHWTEPSGFRPFWTVTKHADVLEIEQRPQIFENGPRAVAMPIEEEEKIKRHTGGRLTVQRSILSMNGAEHTNYRAIAREFFLPRNIIKLRERIGEAAASFVDRMAQLNGSCEFVDDIAAWYPMRVIMLIFGLPQEHEPLLFKLSKESSRGQDPTVRRPGLSEAEHKIAVLKDFFDFFRPIVEDRRAHPRDDLASAIANAKRDDEYLSDELVYSFYLTICVAGHDSTSEALAGGLLALLEHPEQMARLRAEPELMPTAVEEVMRWTTPLKHFFRNAVSDYEIRGKQIKAGDGLFIAYPSANRDEDVFPDPLEFRIDRKPNPVLTFGAGPHICLGQFLAREELKIFYAELLARFDRIELAGDPEFLRTLTFGGAKRLPLRYSNAGAPA